MFTFIRSVFFYLGYVPVTIVMSFCFILVFPLLPQRGRHVFAVSWCNAILGWLKLTCGVKYAVTGRANLPSEAAVVLSNHQSSWETIYYYTLLFPVAPIIKKELTRIPFWGWAMWLLKPIAIDRSKPRKAGKSLLTQGASRIGEGYSVIVFPEGTRSNPDEVRRFSRGGAKLAVTAQAPVVPIAHNAGHCWPPRSFLKHPGTIDVVIGKPISSVGKTADELTAVAEKWIRKQVVAISD